MPTPASQAHSLVLTSLNHLAALHPRYEWLGVYLLRGDTLVLGPYLGTPTEHTRIPVGKGVCGTAVAERANQIIRDVRELDNYIACSASVRSEIVVLVWHEGRIVGQLDADCDTVAAFGPADEALLTELAQRLSPAVALLADGGEPA